MCSVQESGLFSIESPYRLMSNLFLNLACLLIVPVFGKSWIHLVFLREVAAFNFKSQTDPQARGSEVL